MSLTQYQIYIDVTDQSLVSKYYKPWGVEYQTYEIGEQYLQTAQLTEDGLKKRIAPNGEWYFTISRDDKLYFRTVTLAQEQWLSSYESLGRVCWVVDLDSEDLYNDLQEAILDGDDDLEVTYSLWHKPTGEEWGLLGTWCASIVEAEGVEYSSSSSSSSEEYSSSSESSSSSSSSEGYSSSSSSSSSEGFAIGYIYVGIDAYIQ